MQSSVLARYAEKPAGQNANISLGTFCKVGNSANLPAGAICREAYFGTREDFVPLGAKLLNSRKRAAYCTWKRILSWVRQHDTVCTVCTDSDSDVLILIYGRAISLSHRCCGGPLPSQGPRRGWVSTHPRPIMAVRFGTGTGPGPSPS
eukprot:jgi/Botrbrau1/15186/Bobra.0149s0051.1